MFLKKIKNSFKKTHLRLALVFSLIFIISSVILFAFSFFFLYSSMNGAEEEETNRRLLNYWALFQSEGIDLVILEIEKESFLYGDRPFFARIADNTNTTLFLRYPESWAEYSIESLEDLPINNFEDSLILNTKNSENVLKVYTVWLSEKYILQIGISTARSDQLLNLYKRNFIFLLFSLVLLGFGAGAFFSGRFLSPLRSLNYALKNILSTGDFSKRIPQRGIRDDLEEVISMFNTMLKRIETLIFQMKGNLDTVAHDLRTPMTIFRGYAEQALNNPDDIKAAREALSSSLEQSEKILSMLTTIMDISEAEAGTLKLHIENLKLDHVLESLVEMYEFISLERNIRIELQTFPCQIKADPVRIRQAISNVIDNAIKYSPNGGLIKISMEKQNLQIFINIKDSGFGITKDDMPFIWDRLYRSPHVNDISGTGLGLSVVKAVLMAHKGSVSAESIPGKGSTFIISLPESL
jgi:signal transduction histidine kinase